MCFHTHVPPAPLRPYIAVAHGYRVPANPTGVHRGLPSRHLTLVVELHAPLRVRGSRSWVAAHAVAGGLHHAPVIIDASQPQEGLQYALTPLGAEALLGVPAAALGDLVVDLVDLLGPAAGELVDRLAEIPDWTRRFRCVDAAMLQRLDTRAHIAGEVAEAWRLIFTTDGRLPVAGLAQRVGWSRRHLSERFRMATGLTPKQAARIARFEATRRMLLAGNELSLAHIAAECGYADQPHLAREWKALSGCSISTWLREELPFVQDDVAQVESSSGT